jgi:hypothetical protein
MTNEKKKERKMTSQISRLVADRNNLKAGAARKTVYAPDRACMRRHDLKAGDWVCVEGEAGSHRGERTTIVFLNVRRLRPEDLTFQVVPVPGSGVEIGAEFRFTGADGDELLLRAVPLARADGTGETMRGADACGEDVRVPRKQIGGVGVWKEEGHQSVWLAQYHDVPRARFRDMDVVVPPELREKWEAFCFPFREADRRELEAFEARRRAEEEAGAAAQRLRAERIGLKPVIAGPSPLPPFKGVRIGLFDGKKGGLAHYFGQPAFVTYAPDPAFAFEACGWIERPVAVEMMGVTPEGAVAAEIRPLDNALLLPGAVASIGALTLRTVAVCTAVGPEGIVLTVRVETKECGSMARGPDVAVTIPLADVERVDEWRFGMDSSLPQKLFLARPVGSLPAGELTVDVPRDREEAWKAVLDGKFMDRDWAVRTFFADRPDLLPTGRTAPTATWEEFCAAAKAAGLVKSDSSSWEVYSGGIFRDNCERTVTSWRKYVVVRGKEVTIDHGED